MAGDFDDVGFSDQSDDTDDGIDDKFKSVGFSDQQDETDEANESYNKKYQTELDDFTQHLRDAKQMIEHSLNNSIADDAQDILYQETLKQMKTAIRTDDREERVKATRKAAKTMSRAEAVIRTTDSIFWNNWDDAVHYLMEAVTQLEAIETDHGGEGNADDLNRALSFVADMGK